MEVMSSVMIFMIFRSCSRTDVGVCRQRLVRVPNLIQRSLNVMLQFVEFQWIFLLGSSPLLGCFRGWRLGCRRRRGGELLAFGWLSSLWFKLRANPEERPH